VHTEDLAVRAFQLAPQRFCWRKYPERIDLDIARVSLTDARKSRTVLWSRVLRILAELTQAGIQWVEQPTTVPHAFAGRGDP